MKRKITALFLMAFSLGLSVKAQIYEGKNAHEWFSGAEMVRYEPYTSVPTFVRLNSGQHVSLETFPAFAKKMFHLNGDYGWQIKQSTKDDLGFFHQRLTQTFKGYPIEGATYLVHSQGGEIKSMNGDVFNDMNVSVSRVITESIAFTKALNFVNAELYLWEQTELKENSHSHEYSTEKPAGELVIVARDGNISQKDFRLAYKYDIYAVKPLSREYIYVDALNGEILANISRIHTADVPGTAITKYSGSQPIIADSYTGGFRLRETGRGGGIRTLNLETGTSVGNAVDFVDSDNTWNNVNAQKDEAATDAHWASEHMYDFYMNHYNRNGINGTGGMIYCYMHYDVNYFNAFWDGTAMYIGDGSSQNQNKPLSAMDIIGHEMTHGVTQFTANLVYQGESGALNESFSDIFGTAIEFESKPTTANWLIGSEIGVTLRSMSNPGQYGDPDTYGGNNWINPTSATDNGGVHTNSGVQNFWFYLLCQGGTGTNDNAAAYNVSGIGIAKAQDICYRTLSTYLTNNSDFMDARIASIQSATDLYGPCTNEVIAVANAWHAAGVGNVFTPGVTSDFTTPITSGCSVPYTVQFNNMSSNGGSYSWNFGDGTTGTGTNPSHTYTTFGTYTVSLFADGGSCGTDTEIKTNYINISPSNPCIIVLNTNNTQNQTQTTCQGTLYDTGGTSNYGADTDVKITIAPAGASNVTLNFTNFAFESGYDYLYVYDGATINSPLIGQYSGTNLPNGGTITSSCPAITVRQTTDPAVEESGFVLNWTCVIPNTPPNTDFEALSTSACDGVIDFKDKSIPTPASWLWDFGDGTTSTLQNPVHTYTANGTYTVKLTGTNNFGSNDEIKTSYVTVNMPAAPTYANPNPSVISGQTATLNANASGSIVWYNAGGTQIASGNSYTTPPLTANTTYYAQNIVAAPVQTGGPAANTIGAGGYFNNPVRHLKFDVLQNCTLKSVKAYAENSGTRYIQHRDQQGVVINDTAVYLNQGQNTVVLDFPLTPGLQYQLGVDPGIQNPALYRNSAGAVFPYNAGGLVSITGTDATAAGYYYFFYDWNVVGEDCQSPQSPITVNVTPNSIQSGLKNGRVSLYPNPGNGQFSLDITNGTSEDISVHVYNMLGQQQISTEKVFTDSFRKSFDVTYLSAGTYFVQVQVGEEILFMKYIKE
ncbi:MAG: M4 family metallopeptidase [Bacteroidia bacterium]|nr:M4 family metallopeptidase [Bacteroidia bacterium]